MRLRRQARKCADHARCGRSTAARAHMKRVSAIASSKADPGWPPCQPSPASSALRRGAGFAAMPSLFLALRRFAGLASRPPRGLASPRIAPGLRHRRDVDRDSRQCQTPIELCSVFRFTRATGYRFAQAAGMRATGSAGVCSAGSPCVGAPVSQLHKPPPTPPQGAPWRGDKYRSHFLVGALASTGHRGRVDARGRP